MPEYNDNRQKFTNMFPWEVSPATAHTDNPKKYPDVVYSRRAVRENAAGLPRPVRVATAPQPAQEESLPLPIEIPEVEKVPTPESCDLGDPVIQVVDGMSPRRAGD